MVAFNKWLFRLLLASLMFMSQISPNGVASNISAWAEMVGLKKISLELAPLKWDQIIFWPAWGLALLYCLFLLWRQQKSAKNEVYYHSLSVERDVWLYDAIWRAYTGQWDYYPQNVDAEKLYKAVAANMRQYAYEGKLLIWGKKTPRSVWELLDSHLWKHFDLDWVSFLKHDKEKMAFKRGNISHTSLMTSRALVEKLWPSSINYEIPKPHNSFAHIVMELKQKRALGLLPKKY